MRVKWTGKGEPKDGLRNDGGKREGGKTGKGVITGGQNLCGLKNRVETVDGVEGVGIGSNSPSLLGESSPRLVVKPRTPVVGRGRRSGKWGGVGGLRSSGSCEGREGGTLRPKESVSVTKRSLSE